MVCKACGAEIAERALICYKCGAATFEPVRRPVPVARLGSRTPWSALAAGAALLIGVLGPAGADWLVAPLAYGGAGVLAAVAIAMAVRSN